MANKANQEPKQNKIIAILKTEYPFERILLGLLGAFVLLLGVYLVQGTVLTIRLTSWWIFNSALKRDIFAIIIIVIGSVAFLMSIWPFFVPSFSEMRKVTWPNRSTILNHSARVFGFIILLGLFFVAADAGLRPLFKWLIG